MRLEITVKKCWIASEPIDFRRGINGLCQTVISILGKHPKEGVFIFYSKDRKKIKLLGWHRNGFVMIYKQFSQGRLHCLKDKKTGCIMMDKRQLSWLLAGLDWQAMSEHEELSFSEYF